MKAGKFIWIAFVLVAVVQLLVPAKMVWDSNHIMSDGTEYKFRLKPVDPTDPFRGKYIVLDYEADEYPITGINEWIYNQPIYVSLGTDSAGYAKVTGVSKTKPAGKGDFCKATVDYISSKDMMVPISYPFNQFYMEESKAPAAETFYREAMRDTTKVMYGLVMVKDGEAVLKDVMVDGKSLTKVLPHERE